jgi:hypothetical protein
MIGNQKATIVTILFCVPNNVVVTFDHQACDRKSATLLRSLRDAVLAQVILVLFDDEFVLTCVQKPDLPPNFFLGVLVGDFIDPIPLLRDVDVANLTAESVLMVRKQ